MLAYFLSLAKQESRMNKTINVKVVDLIIWGLSLLFAFGLLINEALAEPRTPAVANGGWKAECRSCDTAYAPALLPAATRRQIMAGLDRHFGADASIDAAGAAEIGNFDEEKVRVPR